MERAKLEQEDAKSPVEKPKGLKGLWSRIKRIATDVKEKRLKGSDFAAAATYGALKSAAMYMGATHGAEVGHAVGSNVHLENLTKDKKVIDLDKLKDDCIKETLPDQSLASVLLLPF